MFDFVDRRRKKHSGNDSFRRIMILLSLNSSVVGLFFDFSTSGLVFVNFH